MLSEPSFTATKVSRARSRWASPVGGPSKSSGPAPGGGGTATSGAGSGLDSEVTGAGVGAGAVELVAALAQWTPYQPAPATLPALARRAFDVLGMHGQLDVELVVGDIGDVAPVDVR